MKASRAIFNERMQAILSSTSEELLISKDPTNILHNNRALLLRNGISIQLFITLEDFIRNRTKEITSSLTGSHLKFSNTTDFFQRLSTINLLSTIKYMVDKKDDFSIASDISFAQQEAYKIASTSTTTVQYSDFLIGYDKPNISSGDIENLMIAFGVEKPWDSMGGVLHLIGITGTSVKSLFDKIAKQRHYAAHNPKANIEITDLLSSINETIYIALSFDLLMSASTIQMKTKLTNKKLINHRSVKLRILKRSGSNYRELVSLQSPRSLRNYQTRDESVSTCLPKCIPKHEALLIFDTSIPFEWHTPSID